MMQILWPTYTLRVTIKDMLTESGTAISVPGFAGINSTLMAQTPQHKFHKDGKTGCDEALAAVRAALQKAGLPNAVVTLERYEHT